MNTMNRTLQVYHPRKVVFGRGCLASLGDDLLGHAPKHVLVITGSALVSRLKPLRDLWERHGIRVGLDLSISGEPSFDGFSRVLQSQQTDPPDAVLGIGGGSIMDVAKLVASQLVNPQPLDQIIGTDRLGKRKTLLICVPTTSGTGSEVSPNAIFIDGRDGQKKGVISPELVADAVYVDPELTVSLPAEVTAATGLDALSHCIEAFTNRFCHPLIDTYAVEGTRLITAHLSRAYQDGGDMEARSAMALGSLYGGVCLGPVNTAAVHALSYPLGCRFHIAHGLSNAVLLPHVMRFNLPAARNRYQALARAMGCDARPGRDLAESGIDKVIELMQACGIPLTLKALDIPRDAIPLMGEEAMQITRLLKNNPREVTLNDALDIYHAAYC